SYFTGGAKPRPPRAHRPADELSADHAALRRPGKWLIFVNHFPRISESTGRFAMRQLAAIALALLMSAHVTLAADLPRPGPAFIPTPVQAGYDWTGFYLGANAGGGWANAKSDFSFGGNPAFASATNSLVGALGGLQLGYNWQRGPAVFGLETDFQ